MTLNCTLLTKKGKKRKTLNHTEITKKDGKRKTSKQETDGIWGCWLEGWFRKVGCEWLVDVE